MARGRGELNGGGRAANNVQGARTKTHKKKDEMAGVSAARFLNF